MFDIGFSEFLVIGLVALLVFAVASVLWARHEARKFDRTYGPRRNPGE